MKVRKLLVADIRCRACNASPGEPCRTVLGENMTLAPLHNGNHGERIAEHAELERAGWEWQEVDPHDANPNRRGGD